MNLSVEHSEHNKNIMTDLNYYLVNEMLETKTFDTPNG